jgi:NAD(P)-dependent dehydrogenase (short-subunit alcohol dehydrogenase family)
MARTTADGTTVALVTGANRGLGREVARGLGQRGVTVLMGARSPESGRPEVEKLQAEGVDARLVQLDVSDDASVRAAAARVRDEFGHLDALVNNAGVGAPGTPVTELTPDLLRRTLDTNVIGVVRVTNAMLPLLERAPAARIVTMSSLLGSLAVLADPDHPAEPYARDWAAYGASKAALNALTLLYANAFRDSPVKVNAAHPGYCATDMTDHVGFRSAEQGAAIAVHLATLDDDGPSGSFLDEEGPVPW